MGRILLRSCVNGLEIDRALHNYDNANRRYVTERHAYRSMIPNYLVVASLEADAQNYINVGTRRPVSVTLSIVSSCSALDG